MWPHPFRRLAPALSLVLLAAVACGEAPPPEEAPPRAVGTRRYDGRPVSFRYPENWIVLAAGAPEGQPESGPSSRVLVGLDELNRVQVVGFPASMVVTRENFEERRPQIERAVAQGLEAARARVRRGPEVIEVGGHPALRWEITMQSGVGYVVRSTLVVLFRGSREYVVQCSRIPAREEEIARGCDQILRSAQFTYQAPLVAPTPR